MDDARAFIERTHEKYDLIVYSILDSHTTSSYYTNIRLDNYVYTLESIQRTRELLNPDGVFVLSFSSERPWFAGRLRGIVEQAFERSPLMVHVAPEFFIVGNGDRIARTLAGNPELQRFIDSRSTVQVAAATPSTDDWPYLYQQNRGVPSVVWLLSIGLTLVCWLTFRRLKASREGIQWHFFFLGAAFMLLEVQVVSKAALLFGTTWLVNSIVISSMLAFILLSNLVASRFPKFPRGIAYLGLFATLALSYLLSARGLFFESMAVRGLAATALYCSPVFFAGLIFIASFREAGFRARSLRLESAGVSGGRAPRIAFVPDRDQGARNRSRRAVLRFRPDRPKDAGSRDGASTGRSPGFPMISIVPAAAERASPSGLASSGGRPSFGAMAVLGLALALAWVIALLHRAFPLQPERAVMATGVLCAVLMAAVLGAYLARRAPLGPALHRRAALPGRLQRAAAGGLLLLGELVCDVPRRHPDLVGRRFRQRHYQVPNRLSAL